MAAGTHVRRTERKRFFATITYTFPAQIVGGLTPSIFLDKAAVIRCCPSSLPVRAYVFFAYLVEGLVLSLLVSWLAIVICSALRTKCYGNFCGLFLPPGTDV